MAATEYHSISSEPWELSPRQRRWIGFLARSILAMGFIILVLYPLIAVLSGIFAP